MTYSTDPQDISDAIEFLVDLIEETPAGDRQAMLQEAANEYKVNPVLLGRKFQEVHISPVDIFVPVSKERQEADKKEVLDRAMAKAEKWAGEYVGRSQHFGKMFKFQGEEFIFVVIQSNQPQWGLKAVQISDASRHKFSHGAWNSIIEQLKKA